MWGEPLAWRSCCSVPLGLFLRGREAALGNYQVEFQLVVGLNRLCWLVAFFDECPRLRASGIMTVDRLDFSAQLRATLEPASFAEYASHGHWVQARHLDLLNRRLLDVAAETCTRLSVTMPLRHGTSELTSRFLPAWWLGTRPDDRVILASYESDCDDESKGHSCHPTPEITTTHPGYGPVAEVTHVT